MIEMNEDDTLLNLTLCFKLTLLLFPPFDVNRLL